MSHRLACLSAGGPAGQWPVSLRSLPPGKLPAPATVAAHRAIRAASAVTACSYWRAVIGVVSAAGDGHLRAGSAESGHRRGSVRTRRLADTYINRLARAKIHAAAGIRATRWAAGRHTPDTGRSRLRAVRCLWRTRLLPGGQSEQASSSRAPPRSPQRRQFEGIGLGDVRAEQPGGERRVTMGGTPASCPHPNRPALQPKTGSGTIRQRLLRGRRAEGPGLGSHEVGTMTGRRARPVG